MPTVTKKKNASISLIDALLCGVTEGLITAYDASKDDEFHKPMSLEEFNKKLSGYWDSAKVSIPDPPYEKEYHWFVNSLKKEDIIMYKIKEDWFFDRATGEMEVRILGICPMALRRDDKGNLHDGLTPLFWIYYPEARAVLAQSDAYNNHKENETKSWDDLFFKRYFNSYIIKVANVKNQKIADDEIGMDQLINAEKAKEDVINFESDLWDY